MTTKTRQKLMPPACLAILCCFCFFTAGACAETAKPAVPNGAAPTPDQVGVDKKATSAQGPIETHKQVIEGDDIAIGLLGSLRIADPTYDDYFTPSVWQGGRKSVAERDEKMRQLKAFLASRPASAAPIEFFVGDASFESHGCVSHQSAMRMYYAKTISEKDVSVLASLGFVRVDERDWQIMRPWMQKAVTKTKPWLPRVSDLWEVVVFSYHDGARWRIVPWFYLSLVPEMRDATETDFAILTLIEYLNCKMQPPVPFAQHYRTHLFYDSELRSEFEKDFKQGRK